MPALSDNAIIDVDYYKNYAGIDVSDDFNDNELNQFINQASVLMESEAGRKFRSNDATEIFDGNDTVEYIVKQKRITTLTTLSYWDGDSWEDITSPDYVYDTVESTGKIYFTDGNTFWQGVNNWKAVYTYGWSLATMPEELKLCCCDVVQWLYFLRKKSNISSESLGDKSVTYKDNASMPSSAKTILQKYKSFRYV